LTNGDDESASSMAGKHTIVESTNRADTKGAPHHIRMHHVRVDSFLFERDGRVESGCESYRRVLFVYINKHKRPP